MKAPKRNVKVIIEGEEYLVEVGDLTARPITAIVDGIYYQVELVEGELTASALATPVETISLENSLSQKLDLTPTQPKKQANAITAPLPGDVVDILVKPGEKVSTGQAVCVVEAMKMKNTIRSPRDGRVANIEITKGDSVKYGDVLITFE
jgi:biotin carboxyl carrier protein